MLIRIFLLAVILFFQINLTGQNIVEEKCGTVDTPNPFFDSGHFENFQRNYTLNKRNDEVTMIPVAARIVRFSHGEGGLDPVDLTEIMDSLNARFVSSNIQFYQCGEPQYVDEGLFFNFDRSLYADSLVTYNIPNVINIYFINKILNDDITICGYASFPWNDKNQEYVVVKNSCAMNGSTLAHEVGHYLGLWHTHTTINGPELVNGTNCKIAGDELCDTPADPRLSSNNVDTACVYKSSATDSNNQRYEPDPTNIMSYSRKSCRTYFSPDQSTRMAYYLQRDRSHLVCNVASSTSSSYLEKLSVYPNPARDYIQLEIDLNHAEKLNLQLYDLLGRPGYQTEWQITPGSNQYRIPLTNIRSGIYILRLGNGQDIHAVKILVGNQ